MDLTVMLVSAVVCLIIFFWFRRTDPRLPPSPMRPLPVVGHLFYMSPDSRTQFPEFRKRCGDIYSLYLGGFLVVVINGYDLIKEALLKKGESTSDRPPYFLDLATGIQGKGVLFASGDYWKEQRAVSLSILKAFGMGKNLMADQIQEEVGCFINYLASLEGKPTDIHAMTHISAANIISFVLIGHRFEYKDKHFQDFMCQMNNMVTDQKNVALVNFLPWLRHIPGDLFNAKRIMSFAQICMQMLTKFIVDKRRHLDHSSEVCNFIDAYTLEKNKKTQAGVATTMDDESLSRIMFDLFVAGTETTSTTISWCLLYMLHNPHVQEIVYEEIKDEIGTDRTPTIHDRAKLTYLNAVIMETQRLASIVSLSASHFCTETITLRGYTIPNGAWILPNLDSVLHDTVIWGDDAMSFRPERFLDDQGKLQIPEQFIPYSIGKRACLGEGMAKMELFLFLSSMFQRFKFLPSVPVSLPDLKHQSGGVVTPKYFEIRLVERN
ncbi:hypothetical protein BsWGS_09940 [Bradybaena similaris]